MIEALHSFNPLRSTGTPLPPGLLTTAKCLFVTSTLQGYVHRLPDPFLPFVPAIDAIPGVVDVSRALQVVALSAGACLLLNRAVRASCIVLGLVYGFALLSSRVYYLNATVFLACMLLLIGLYQRPAGLLLVRLQLVVMYTGSAINKMLDPDWRSGQYFEHWMREIIASPIYAAAAELLPPMSLSQTMCWVTIGIEAMIAIAVATPRLRRLGAGLIVFAHTAMWIISGKMFGIFYSALIVSLPVLLDWPTSMKLACDPRNRIARAFRRLAGILDADDRFAFVTRDGFLEGRARDRARRGAAMTWFWAIYSPAVYLGIAVGLAMPALWKYFVTGY